MPKKKQCDISDLLEKRFLSEADLERLGLRSRKTSQNLRSRGVDPLPYVRFGKSIRYPAEAVREYCERRTVAPEE
jgi:hypothetical protein